MRQQIDVLYSEISGTPEELISQAQKAVNEGATNYNTVSGQIVFYRLQDEREYLETLKEKYSASIKIVKARLKEISK